MHSLSRIKLAPFYLLITLLGVLPDGIEASPAPPADPPCITECSTCNAPPDISLPIILPSKPQSPTCAPPKTHSFVSYTEGNMGDDVPVLNVADSINLSLHYDSFNADTSNYRVDTVLGFGWTHSYNLFITEYRFDAYLHQGNGKVTKFRRTPSGNYIPQTGYFDNLVKIDTNTYVITDKEGTQFRYEKLNPAPFLMPGPPFYIKSITDRNGLQTKFQYNANNRLEKIIDPFDRAVIFAYNTDKKIHSITDPLGRVTQFQYGSRSYDLLKIVDSQGYPVIYRYNANHQMVGKTDKSGNTFSFAYNANGKPIAESDSAGNKLLSLSNPNNWAVNTSTVLTQTLRLYIPGTTTRTDGRGNVWRYDYEEHGYITKITAPDGTITRYSYDPVTLKVASVTDANGHTTKYQYDNRGNIIKITDSLGQVTQYTYEPVFNHITSVTDANGNVTTYAYDANGNQIQETDPLGRIRTWTYDSQGHVLTQADKNGVFVRTYEYDVFGNRTKETNGAGDATRYTYDAVGNTITITTRNGNILSQTYDNMNRLTKIEDLMGLVGTTTYDGNGNRISQTDGNGNSTQFEYDLRARLVKITDTLNHISVQTYDGNDNRVSITNRNGHTTNLTYDSQNRLVQTTDALGRITRQQYDGVGNLLKITDDNGHDTNYAYDAINRRIKEIYADGGVRTFAYDLVGNLISRTDQIGQTTAYSYDPLNRLIQRAYPFSPADNFSYDAEGNILTAERGGWVVSFVYDAAYRVTQTQQNGATISYAYDIPGQTRTLTYPGGRVITEQTDLRSRLDQTVDLLSPQPIVKYTYDLGNRVVSRAYGNGTEATYSNNPNDWILAIDHSNGVSTFARFAYEYDAEGNKHFEEKSHDPVNSEAYQYDSINRLTNFKVGNLAGSIVPFPLTETSYNLDPVGNWNAKIKNGVTETRNHNEVNELIAINGAPLNYDANGNLSEDSRNLYHYDEENRLIRVTRKSDNRVVGLYQYDAFSRRVDTQANPLLGVTEARYFYDGVRIIEEQNNLGATLATYVYGNYIDEVLTMDRGGQAYYYHQNALWSVEAISDSAANVVERYAYDAYGDVTITNDRGNILTNSWGTPHSAIGNSYTFTGRQLDEEAGLYFYMARFYDSNKGRFLQRDPLGYFEGLNLYQYVGSNPIARSDPFGLKAKDDKCCDAAKQLIDEAISGLLEQAKNLPGQTGQIAKIIDMLKKIKDTGESCKAMSDVAKTCADFAKDPTVESCYACCQGIYASFGNLFGGIGHFVCTGICSKFD